MREIMLDSRRPAWSHQNGDRLIEIGCIELVNRIPSRRDFTVRQSASATCLPRPRPYTGFDGVAEGQADVHRVRRDSLIHRRGAIVIHNAAFDIGFLNSELGRCARRSPWTG